jgi:hypothetical protein
MRYILVLMLACFTTPVIAGDFDYEAEAALALASAKLKPTPIAAAPCEFCGVACKCQNCGCDSYHGKKAGAVPVASTFPVKQSHAGHNCPSCGYDRYPDTYIQRGAGPVRGTHLHACPKCGTTWFH